MLRVALATAAAALALSACSVQVDFPGTDTQQGAAPANLADLRVATEKNDGTYDRKRFGSPWKDVDGNRCDTRNDILARDLKNVVKRDDGCTVLSGLLEDDPYTDQSIEFSKERPTAVQIDHIYPLALAWRLGASQWDDARRADFANDPDNLLAVGGRENQRKSDKGPDEWEPPADYQCAYAQKFTAIALEYDLPVTQPAHDALARMLKTC
ncbi:HNH endonuclease family protein [Actinocorallia sp. API 0066]|uniref:HNH endonuclease family protein n=1 Tax=Actinocorallia sp. API 0066 TaxID=2896846 RepID=UPI001E514973|nr:HNH endonuclease family protein [Actinocorallia sp. API 0066]MCD0450303.1 HNH endonuclease family protein [Actinocorallia sp. API 0066]